MARNSTCFGLRSQTRRLARCVRNRHLSPGSRRDRSGKRSDTLDWTGGRVQHASLDGRSRVDRRGVPGGVSSTAQGEPRGEPIWAGTRTGRVRSSQACRATRCGRLHPVERSLSRPARRREPWHLPVADTGDGIPVAHPAHVLEYFHRGERRRKRRPRSLGHRPGHNQCPRRGPRRAAHRAQRGLGSFIEIPSTFTGVGGSGSIKSADLVRPQGSWTPGRPGVGRCFP
jgi:hypothetical protein